MLRAFAALELLYVCDFPLTSDDAAELLGHLKELKSAYFHMTVREYTWLKLELERTKWKAIGWNATIYEKLDYGCYRVALHRDGYYADGSKKSWE